jgi:hypothetical protein
MSLNKVLALLLVVIFIIFSLATILAWSVRGDILNDDAYVAALDEAGFYEVPYQLIREGDIPAAGGLLLRVGPFSVLSGADREAVARELAPPDWLRAQIERAVRDLVAVARAPELDELPDFTISLQEVKARALGEPGDRALSIVVQTLPQCEAGRSPLELGSDTPICRPAEAELTPFLDRLKTLLSPLVERVPDMYRVQWQPRQQGVLEDLQGAGRTLDRLQVPLLLLVVLNLALLALAWVLAVRSPAEWLRWTGVPLLLLGLLVLLTAFLTPRVVAWGLESQALSAGSNVPLPLAQSLERAIQDLAGLLFRPALQAGAVLAVVGLLLTLLSPLFPGQQRGGRPMPGRSMR